MWQAASGQQAADCNTHFALLLLQDGREVVQQVVGYKKKPLEQAVEQLAHIAK